MSKALIEWQLYGQDPHVSLLLLSELLESSLTKQLALQKVLQTRLFARVIPAAAAVGYKDTEGLKQRVEQARAESDREVEKAKEGNQLYQIFLKHYEKMRAEQFSKEQLYTVIEDNLMDKGSQISALNKTLALSRLLYETGQYDQSHKLAQCLHSAFKNNVFDDSCVQWGIVLSAIMTDDYLLFDAAFSILQEEITSFTKDIFYTNGEFTGSNATTLQANLYYCLRKQKYARLLKLGSWLPFVKAILPFFIRYFIVAELLTADLHSAFQAQASYGPLSDYDYHDEFTELVRLVYHEFDFKAAFNHVAALEKSIEEDIYLRPHKEELLQRIRQLLLAQQVKLYSEVSLLQVQTLCGKDGVETDKWLIRVLRRTEVEGEIDHERGKLVLRRREDRASSLVGKRLREVRLRNRFL